MQTDALTISAKYIYLDVVKFTQNRSVEAQVDIVHQLNSIVSSSITEFEIAKEKVVLLPTGDGLCIAFLNVEFPYDVHILLALDIVKKVHEHNQTAQNEMRKFEIRIGVNANTDNLVTDINGNQNIAGAGINMAQRVMNTADGNQIMVGQSVFDTLSQREKYMKAFRQFSATAKHDVQMPVSQLIANGNIGLNTDIPSLFVSIKAPEELSPIAAYYFAQAIEYRQFFLTKRDEPPVVGVVLLWHLAKDFIETIKATEAYAPKLITYKAKEGNIEAQYKHYDEVDFNITFQLWSFIIEHELPPFLSTELYEGTLGDQRFISPKGVAKLKQDWPYVWQHLDLNKYTSKSEEYESKTEENE